MKISESLQSDYIQTQFWKRKESKTLGGRIAVRLADALQQAVAENLEMRHQLSPQHRVMLINGMKRCLACDWNESTDWLAEADKLLRGEK